MLTFPIGFMGGEVTHVGNDEYTKMLIHSNTTSGSTVFNNSAVGGGQLITAAGDVQHSTAAAKFGNSSIIFDGTGDYMTLPAHADFNFAGEFCLDFWYNTTTTAELQILNKRGGAWGSGDYNITMGYPSAGKISFIFNDGSTQILSDSATTNDGAWHHCSITRDASNVINLFIDGTTVANQTNSISMSNSDLVEFAPDSGGGSRYIGYLDEIRFNNGAYRWDANFTPPTAAYI